LQRLGSAGSTATRLRGVLAVSLETAMCTRSRWQCWSRRIRDVSHQVVRAGAQDPGVRCHATAAANSAKRSPESR
jgi:hypothetical protein